MKAENIKEAQSLITNLRKIEVMLAGEPGGSDDLGIFGRGHDLRNKEIADGCRHVLIEEKVRIEQRIEEL